MSNNICLDTDSYKVSMWKQYPPGTQYVYSYVESRGGRWNRTQFLGVQAFAKRLAETRVTKADVDKANAIWTVHGEPFNYEGWMYIVNECGGILPLRIEAAKEGMIIPVSNVLATVVNTDPNCYWLTTWVETALLRAIWYPTTVGTQSYFIKQTIKQYLEESGAPELLEFKLHDFGARGVSSEESAGIGGAAHLVNFRGTDTISGVLHVTEVYGDDVAGFSIPAAEHSTITSWGRANEVDAYRNMVKQFGGEGKLVAVVSDSYDIYNACKLWGTELKQDVIDSKATVIIRPDSGDPLEVLPRMFRELESTFGAEKNAKGYKVLNNVRVIWGDGINQLAIEGILRTLVAVYGYSADNIAFGMGGALLQQLDRDTQRFAMKCSAIKVAGEEVVRDVFKEPITDSGKSSKKGLVELYQNPLTGGYVTMTRTEASILPQLVNAMECYYDDGDQPFTQSFLEVRANSEL